MKKKTTYTLWNFLVAVVILFSGCANMVTPTGGAKDVTPPKVVEANPENHSLNFSGNKIEISFDEFVTLDNAKQNILISPPLATSPDFKLSNNKAVVIKFKEPLAPNTTYTINFGKAVKDFHEGNVFKDYIYSFSTGDHLDTLAVTGKVIDAANDKPVEDLMVGLYDGSRDSLFFLPTTCPPDYISKTDKEGRFTIQGLPDKKFLVFALKDMNSNLFYDMPNETVAFLDTLVAATVFKPEQKAQDKKGVGFGKMPETADSADTATKVTDTIAMVTDTIAMVTDTVAKAKDSIAKPIALTLRAFVEEDTTQMLLEKKLVDEGLLRFCFRHPAEAVKVERSEPLVDSFKIVEVWSAEHDTLWYYFSPNVIDSLQVHIQYDTLINDSTRYSLKYRETKKRGRNANKKIVKVSNNLQNNLLLPGEEFLLRFSEPMVQDTLTYNGMHFEKADEYGKEYRLAMPIEDTVSYAVNITDSLFYSVRGRTHDTIHCSFRRAMEKDIGNIFITVVPPEGTQLVIQLLNSRGKVVDTCLIDKEQRVEFKRLMPEKYKLKAIIDKDRNGKWSTGNYHKRFLPETVVDYKDPLDLKAGWDIDLNEKWKVK
ncbi:MAG: Ig-like domain-containing protein [Bacteroidales bacterium]|nr:Ig-like domain-containing protein [Bacteroidales bacterium]